MITTEQFQKELDQILIRRHLGNLQIWIYDKLRIYYVKAEETVDDENDNEVLISMEISAEFYGDHYDALVEKDDDYGFTIVSGYGGELLEAFEDKLENELQPFIKILWDAVQNSMNN